MNKDLLVTCHCYAGDRAQVIALLPVMEHHKAPLVIVSPEDSPVHHIGKHICRTAGKRAYIGQDSWDRQYLQLKLLLEYPQKWFLLNDSDSFVLTPRLPDYLFEDEDCVYSNEVNDFRSPGKPTEHGIIAPDDYHEGFPLIAMQPPYFLSRKALEAIVANAEGLQACPITPFIDWWWVPACRVAGLEHKNFKNGASMGTGNSIGHKAMQRAVAIEGANFIHSVKTGAIMRSLVALRKKYPNPTPPVREIKKVEPKIKKVYCCGLESSGNKWIREILRKHPELSVVGESFPCGLKEERCYPKFEPCDVVVIIARDKTCSSTSVKRRGYNDGHEGSFSDDESIEQVLAIAKRAPRTIFVSYETALLYRQHYWTNIFKQLGVSDMAVDAEYLDGNVPYFSGALPLPVSVKGKASSAPTGASSASASSER